MSTAALAGSGRSPYQRHPPPGTTTAQVLAGPALDAVDNAGLDARLIDGLAVSSFTLAPDHAIALAWRLGLHVRWLMRETNGGAGGVNMLQHAVRAVEAGDARMVLIVAGDHFTRDGFTDLVDNYNLAIRHHLAPLPFCDPNSLFAILTQRHAAAHGLARGRLRRAGGRPASVGRRQSGCGVPRPSQPRGLSGRHLGAMPVHDVDSGADVARRRRRPARSRTTCRGRRRPAGGLRGSAIQG